MSSFSRHASEAPVCLTDDDQWVHLLERLPDDIDTTVHTCGAILRKRKIQSAAQFLRLILAYACNLPLDVVVTWAAACGLAEVSRQALNGRIRDASHWLAVLLTQVLAARTGLTALPGLRLCLTDGTSVARPGATGTDWRLHLTFDLEQLHLTHVELTEAHEGESLTRCAPQPGDVEVGDRNFGKRPGVLATVKAGAQALVRIAWKTFPLQTPTGQPFDHLQAMRSVEHGALQEWPVRMAPLHRDDPEVRGRFVVSRLPAEEAAAARERVRKQHRTSAKKNAAGQRSTLDPITVEVAEYLLLFTTVPATVATAAQIVALYRFRWQIELVIKRFKSILDLATLTARHTQLCRAVLLAKLLLAVLTEDLCTDAEVFSPSGGGRPAPASAQSLSPLSSGLALAPHNDSAGIAVVHLDVALA